MIFTVTDFSFSGVIEGFPFIFIVALFIFAFAIILRSVKVFLLQLLLFAGMFVFDISTSPVVFYLACTIQITLALYLLFKYGKALDRNYQLVLEKTHQIPPEITRNGHHGGQKSFLEKA